MFNSAHINYIIVVTALHNNQANSDQLEPLRIINTYILKGAGVLLKNLSRTTNCAKDKIHKPHFHDQEQSCLCTSTRQVEHPQETEPVNYKN